MANKAPVALHNSFYQMAARHLDNIIFFCCKEEAELRMSKMDIEDLTVSETRFGWVIEHDDGDCVDNFRYFGRQWESPFD